MLTAIGAAAMIALTAPMAIADGAAVGLGPVTSYGTAALVNRVSPGGYRLAEVVDGRLRDLDVPPRRVRFDVDVGPGHDGLLTAVYSRCAREPRLGPSLGSFSYRTAERCRLFSVRVRGGRERPISLPAARRAATSRFLPTIWRKQLAWAKTEDHRSEGYRIAEPRLMYMDGAARGRRLRGGSQFFRSSSLGTEGPLSLDLRGRRLTFAWSYVSAERDCRRSTKVDVSPASEAWAVTLGGSRRLLVRAGCRSSGIRAGVLSSAVTPTGLSTLELVEPVGARLAASLTDWSLSGTRLDERPLGLSTADPPLSATVTTDGATLSIEDGSPARLRIDRPGPGA